MRTWKKISREQASKIEPAYVKHIQENYYTWIDSFSPIPGDPDAIDKWSQEMTEKGYLNRDELEKGFIVPTARGEVYFAQAEKSTEVQGGQASEKIEKMVSDLSPEELKRILDDEKEKGEAK